MARKATDLSAILGDAVTKAADQPEANQPASATSPSGGRNPQTKSVTMYTSPAGLKRLKGIALEGDTKVNTILREALDQWLQANGHGGIDTIES